MALSSKEKTARWRAKNPGHDKAYYAANRDAIRAKQRAYIAANSEKHKARSKKGYVDNQAKRLLGHARFRAQKAGVPFNLTLDDISLVACEMTGFPFECGSDGRSPYSPSIDRIEPELGYVKGNTRMVLWCLNAAMGSWGFEFIRSVVHAAENRGSF